LGVAEEIRHIRLKHKGRVPIKKARSNPFKKSLLIVWITIITLIAIHVTIIAHSKIVDPLRGKRLQLALQSETL